MKYRNMTGVLAGLLLLLAACQPSASPTDGSAAPSEAASAPASEGAAPSEAAGVTLTVVETAAGTSLAGADGLTLYVQIEEEGGTIVCVDDCLTNWPPLTETVDAGDADASLLGTIERPDGATQATYNGFPLYYFAGDSAEGDSNGEGLGGVWFIANPSGEFGTS